jgi:hypothetical protein
MTISIIKITCLTTNKIFIAHTTNIKNYMKQMRKMLRRRDRETFMPVKHNMTDRLEYELLDTANESTITLKRQTAIKNHPLCVNVREWKPN